MGTCTHIILVIGGGMSRMIFCWDIIGLNKKNVTSKFFASFVATVMAGAPQKLAKVRWWVTRWTVGYNTMRVVRAKMRSHIYWSTMFHLKP